MDQNIRQAINTLIGAKLPISFFHAKWKYGGLSIQNLQERFYTEIIKIMGKMILNPNKKLKELLIYSLENERKYRKININNNGNSFFFNWEDNSIMEHYGTNCITSRGRIACKKLQIKIDLIKNNNELQIKDLLSNKTKNFSAYSKFANYINKIVEKRWNNKINQNTFNLHGFHSLANSTFSNYFIKRMTKPIKDNLFKFIIKARTNTLPTPQFVDLMNNRPTSYCQLCERNGTLKKASLSHILNSCLTYFGEYTKRHNTIVEILKENIIKVMEIDEFIENATIRIDSLSEENKKLIPDLSIWTNNYKDLIIIEVSCPYASFSNGTSTLEIVQTHKMNKYKSLVEEIISKGIKTKLYTIIISSLGAITKETYKNLLLLFKDTKITNKITRRLNMATINGSWKIWIKRAKLMNQQPELLNELPIDDEETMTEDSESISLEDEEEH